MCNIVSLNNSAQQHLIELPNKEKLDSRFCKPKKVFRPAKRFGEDNSYKHAEVNVKRPSTTQFSDSKPLGIRP